MGLSQVTPWISSCPLTLPQPMSLSYASMSSLNENCVSSLQIFMTWTNFPVFMVRSRTASLVLTCNIFFIVCNTFFAASLFCFWCFCWCHSPGLSHYTFDLLVFLLHYPLLESFPWHWFRCLVALLKSFNVASIVFPQVSKIRFGFLSKMLMEERNGPHQPSSPWPS